MHLNNLLRKLKRLIWLSLYACYFGFTWWAAETVTATVKPTDPVIHVNHPVRNSSAWRKDPRFEKFLPDPALPPIVALEKATLRVGPDLKISLAVLTQMSDQEKDSLAKLLHVPTSVVTKFIATSSTTPQTDAETFAKELRACVIDYRFLVHVWNEFVSLEQDSPKKEAREALAAGDVEKAWQLYPTPTGSHPKPPPPQNLRIVSDSNSSPPPPPK